MKDFGPVTQAAILVPGLIIALLVNPFFGLLSDRTPGRFGRRRPYIVAGTAVNVLGLAMMALGPIALATGHSGNLLAPSIFILLAGLAVTQLSNNAAAAPFHALLPDLVSREQRGIAAGIMGLAQLLGNIGGALVPRFFGFDPTKLLDGRQSFDAFNAQIVRAYAAVAVVIVIMAALTALTVHEQPWSRPAGAPRQQSEMGRTVRALVLTLAAILVAVGAYAGLLQAHVGLSLTTDSLSVVLVIGLVIAGIGTVRAFDFKARRYPDFTWVLVTRFLVMMGIYTVFNFLTLYMLFVAHAPNAAIAYGNFLIILTITATLSTAFAGWASDRLGRKAMVYLSGAFMALVGAAFVLAPYVFPANILTVAYIAGAVFGLGYGAYIAVDWALVADVLPSEATFARDMGVWNIVYTIPQALAVVFGASMIALGTALGSVSLGYTFLFITFAVFCVAGTVTVRYIKGVK